MLAVAAAVPVAVVLSVLVVAPVSATHHRGTADHDRPSATTAIPATTTTTTASTTTSTGAAGNPSPFMSSCGTQFCIGGAVFYPYGATFYESTKQAGIDNPTGEIALAKSEGLNTIRVVDFLDHNGDPSVAPYSSQQWNKVDAVIADGRAAGIRVLLDVSDYKAELWNSCINPYTADWTKYLGFVANHKNSVTGQVYSSDPEIVLVTFTGEPLPVGTHSFTDRFGAACSISYTTQQLTRFYAQVEQTWKTLDPNHLIAAGGLGYVNEANSGIDWKSIFGNADNDVCAWKTYGGMLAWLPTGATYCASVLHKPWFNDEWGYTQAVGDAQRAALFTSQFQSNAANGAAGNFFWNASYLVNPATYDVSPLTPLTEAAVLAHARPMAP